MGYSNNNKLNQQGNEAENQSQNLSNIPPQFSNHNLKIVIVILIILIVALIVLLVNTFEIPGCYIFKNKNISQTEQPTSTSNQDVYALGSFVVPQNAVIANQKTITWNEKKYIITQYCQGTVQNQEIEIGSIYPTVPFCIGNNILVLEYDNTRVKIDETKINSKDKALVLIFAFELSDGKPFITKNGDLLLNYSVNNCLTAGDCGVGQPFIVNLNISLNEGSVRKLNNFPKNWYGEHIWNSSQTKTVFLPATGGAGCGMGPIIGYDLQKDQIISSTQSACGATDSKNITGKDVEGNPENGWTDLHWNNDSQASATLNSPDGKSQVVILDFK